VRRSTFRAIASRLNIEKGVFVVAALWLLAMGVRFMQAPEIPEWGSPRTSDLPRDNPDAGLNDVMPYLKGGRDDVFGWPGLGDEGKVVDDRRRERGPTPTRDEKKRRATDNPNKHGRTKTDEDGLGAEEPRKSSPVRPRFVGTLSVENSGTYMFLADGDKYVAFAPGEGLAGRYRLVKRSAKHIVIEDRSGSRFRVQLP